MNNGKLVSLMLTFCLMVFYCAVFAQSPKRSGITTPIRPYRINVSQASLVDLKQRIKTTRWPSKETVNDPSQGLQSETLKELLRYWGTDYNWRKAEEKLNSFPQFITEIDGLDIQFIHIKSKHPNALPLIMTHGWPGSIFELIKVIGPLTDPTAYGGKAEDAFDLVLPSLPGFGFSGKPTGPGWDSNHIARAWAELMKRLGYQRYVSQGGDCGSVISQRMAVQKVTGLIGIHVNMPGTVPPEVATILAAGGEAPSGLSERERAAFDALDNFYKKNAGYSAIMVTRPQTVGYALADSPAGQAAWIYDKIAQWTYTNGKPEKALSKDEILDDISLYWLTNSATSAAQLYWEDHSNNFNAVHISLPVAVTIFPGEIYRAPRSWGERNYHNLIYWNEVEKGGHFAAWEEPALFAVEVRAAFKSLR